MASRTGEQTGQHTYPEAISRGILSNGSLVANYYTSEPSPGQWVAIGTVMMWPVAHDGGFPRWLLVGVGRTEKLAVADLRARMKAAIPPRWKIKCEPAPAESRDLIQADDASHSGAYVVPWEIGLDDVSERVGLTALEAALS